MVIKFCMQKFISFSLVSLKLVLVACFSFMGGMVVSAEAIDSPCHEQIDGEEMNHLGEENPDVCKTAEKAWSMEFVFETSEITFEEISPLFVSNFENIFGQKYVFLWNIPFPVPPDDTAVLHAHLVAQRTTVLLI